MTFSPIIQTKVKLILINYSTWAKFSHPNQSKGLLEVRVPDILLEIKLFQYTLFTEPQKTPDLPVS